MLLGYLLGSIPAALIVGRAYGVDLRTSGDGNPGAWNALEQLGWRRAWPAFIGDGAKGAAAGFAGLALLGIAGAYAGVAGAMVGHAFSIFARFRGGKSVMTFAGGAFALNPLAAAIALACCALVTLAGRSFAWGARTGVFGFPIVQLAFDPPLRVAATGALMGLIALRFAVAARRSARATSATDGSRSRSATP